MQFISKIASSGTFLIVAAFFIWGISPFYFISLKGVSPFEILAHRVIWSFLFLLFVVFFMKQWKAFFSIFKCYKKMSILLCTTFLISANWFTFIWAIQNYYLTESSFGYFICPLLSVLLGVVFLKERLSLIQKIVCALIFVALCIQMSEMQFSGPGAFVSLILAITFGFYTLLRKTIKVDSMHGLTMETALITPFALGYLVYLNSKEQLMFLGSSMWLDLALTTAWLVTSFPMLLYVAGTRKLPLSSSGLYQYISPILQLLIAIFVFEETMTQTKMISFIVVWFALMVFIVYRFIEQRNNNQNSPSVKV
jgi:chloramphenicol-sensitive protein RarD